MKGLWRLTTSTIDPGLGVVVFGWIVACVVALLTCVSIVRKPKHWPELRLLHTGMVLLSIWFVLHWIDTCVRHNEVIVTYSYILSSDFYNIFRVFSDVFVLWGTWRVLTRYKYLKHKLMFRTTTAIAGLFWFLALYHLGLLFALSFAWLSFSDLRAINAIARARNGFEIVFTTLQFCFTAAACVQAVEIDRAGIQDTLYGTGSPSRRANRPGDAADSLIYKESVLSIPASLALLLRSFCEVIIVGQLDRHPSHIRSIFRGRDVTYGLFSMIFVGFITFAIPSKAAEDPLVRRREDRDRAERAAREDRDRAERAAREAAMEEVRTWIIDKLKEATENGRRTAPTISTLLDTLRSELDLHRPDPDPFDTCGIKTREVDRLRALYVGWEPVYRWRGVNTATSLGRDPPGLGGNPSLGRYASLSRNAGLGRDTGLGRDADSGGNPGLGRNPSLGRYASLSRNAGLGRDAGSGGDAGLGGDAAPLSGHHGTGVIQPEDPHPASGSDSWRPEHTRTCEQQ